MPVFTIETPSGTKLDIEAADQATALNGARQWHAQNAKAPSAGDVATDAYKSLDAGVAGGTAMLLGLVGDLSNLGAKGIKAASDYIGGKLGVEPYQPPSNPGPVLSAIKSGLDKIPTSESMSQTIQKDFYNSEKPYEPKYEVGKYAKPVGELLPGAAAAAMTGGGSLMGNLVRYAAIPGITTQVAEENLPETSWKPYIKSGIGFASSIPNPARIVTPIPATAAKIAAVNTLADEGVTSLTAGQRTGNKSLQYLESAASHAPGAGGGAARIEHEGQHQFTEAAVRRAGTGPDATPEVLAANQNRLRQGYRDISARNTIIPDNPMINDIVDSVTRYHFVPGSQQHAMVQGYIDDIIPHINNGSMSGEHYQALRSFLTADAKAASDGYLKNALTGIRNALDNAMTRSVSPEDAAAWRQLNREYSAQEVIKKAASRAGEATVEGQITPANLRNVIAGEDRGGYALGRGQFNDLARAGVQVMSPLPNTGTAQRANAFHLLNAGLLGVPQALAGRAIMSPPVQAYLSNQLMNGALPNSAEARRLLIAEMLLKTQQPTAEAH